MREIVKGYNAAAEEERKLRAVPLVGIGELIAGIPCAELTPRRLEWLRLFGNPFICGGAVSDSSVMQFLWLVSPQFKPGKEAFNNFLRERIAENVSELREGIELYLDRCYADVEKGKPSKSYTSQWVCYYRALTLAYGAEWTFERVGDTPLKLIFQLLRENDRYQGKTVINPMSDALIQKYLDEINKPKEKKGVNHGRKK